MSGGVTVLLTLSALVLGTTVVAELRYGTLPDAGAAPGAVGASGGPVSVEAAAAPGPATVVARDLPDLGALVATRERPLFFENRRVPEPDEAPAPASVPFPAAATVSTPLGPVKLSAIVIVEDERVALIQDPAGTMGRYRVGDQVNGWSVAAVESESVIFRQGEEEERLELWTYESAPAAPAAPARRGAPDPSRAADRAAALRRSIARRNAARNGGSPPSQSPTPATPEKDCGLSRC